MINPSQDYDDLDGIITSLEQVWLAQARSTAEASLVTDGRAGTAEGEWWGD
jgi:hypothetical protein